ncbi:MAG: uroporphyrinogen-III decarboxylase-like protein [Planctomycetes bacterium]|nr:uroporphyrinogen-III decarboxylase-like protein [Planctomycetota bacterium]
MPAETMTSRERWLAVLERRKPDRVPMDYQATDEATAKLKSHLSVATDEEIFSRLHIDAHVTVSSRYVGPALAENTDAFGCVFRMVDYGQGAYGECIHHPLADFNSAGEIEAGYTWPSPDWYDYSGIAAEVKAAGERPIFGGGSEPFLTYADLRGREQAYMDLLLNKEIVHYCLDKLFDLCYENTTRIYEAAGGAVMASYVAEDMGGQEDLLFSPAQIEEFFIPRMKRMMDLAHSSGVWVFHHSDGAIRKILPRMIEIGSDTLNPVQWRCKGMDREGLKRDFGDDIIFHGAVDNQQTLPFATAEEVRREVIDNLSILGAGGGYILAPCHNIQVVGPPENVVAMYETGYEYGWS